MKSEFRITFGHNIILIAEDNLLLHYLKYKLHVAQVEPDVYELMEKLKLHTP